MHILKKDDGTICFYLTENKPYTIGRKDCDIVLQNDGSISRKHAILTIHHQEVTLRDCKSKYKTFLNAEEIATEIDIILKTSCVIQFGALTSVFRFIPLQIVTTTSSLVTTQKNKLERYITQLGGSVRSTWSSRCKYVTTEEINLNLKILHAIIDNVPLVRLDFWKTFVQNVKKQLPPPEPSDFSPPIIEVLVDKFVSKDEKPRHRLFKNKLFIFANLAIKSKMEEVITKTGGECFSWDVKQPSLAELDSIRKEILVVDHQIFPRTSTNSLSKVVEHLKKSKKRAILLPEIAMAIMTASCELDCNSLIRRDGERNLVLALGTQTQMDIGETTTQLLASKVEIPDSVEADFVSLKRSSYVADGASCSVELKEKENPFKRVKLESNKSGSSGALIIKTELPILKPSFPSLASLVKEESLQLPPPAKKPNPFAESKRLKPNPFSTQNADKVDNPFSGSQTKVVKRKQPVEKADNRAAKKPCIFTSTQNSIDCSNISTTSSVNLSRIAAPLPKANWMHKSTRIKSEVIDLDLEKATSMLQPLVDLVPFQDLSVSHVNTNSRITESNNSTSKNKNFKTFSKVRPLKVQKAVMKLQFKDHLPGGFNLRC